MFIKLKQNWVCSTEYTELPETFFMLYLTDVMSGSKHGHQWMAA
jgi:hypothetical protein